MQPGANTVVNCRELSRNVLYPYNRDNKPSHEELRIALVTRKHASGMCQLHKQKKARRVLRDSSGCIFWDEEL